MSSAICFNLDQSKILSSGNGLIFLWCILAPRSHTQQVPCASTSRAQREQLQQGASDNEGATAGPVVPPPPSEDGIEFLSMLY